MLGDGGVLDAVKDKMPWLKQSGLIIQHDGARPHDGAGNKEAFTAAGVEDGWNIKFRTQPAQSPDVNILDLGLFNSLKSQSNKLKLGAKTIDGLMERVKSAYAAYDSSTLDHVWAHQYAVYNSILREFGGNQYASTHAGLRKNGANKESIVDLSIDVEAYNAAVAYVNSLN